MTGMQAMHESWGRMHVLRPWAQRATPTQVRLLHVTLQLRLMSLLSYIGKLVDRVRRLAPHQHPSPTASTDTSTTDGSMTIRSEAFSVEPYVHYEHHFAYASDDYRYLGAESCLLKSPRLQPRRVPSPLVLDDDADDWHLSWKRTASKEWELLELYMEIIQPVYPILDMSPPVGRYLVQDVPSDLTPTETFSLNMIYSIACYILPNTGTRHNPELSWHSSGRASYQAANSAKYRALARQYYLTAMEHLEAATVDPNLATLRAVLLLAIHSSFDPKSGNFGQQIALSARLAIDLKAKAELQELQLNEVEVLRNMHMTIFSLENQVASTLDRPAVFPEPVCHKPMDCSAWLTCCRSLSYPLT
jgi:hypothetical protein